MYGGAYRIKASVCVLGLLLQLKSLRTEHSAKKGLRWRSGKDSAKEAQCPGAPNANKNDIIITFTLQIRRPGSLTIRLSNTPGAMALEVPKVPFSGATMGRDVELWTQLSRGQRALISSWPTRTRTIQTVGCIRRSRTVHCRKGLTRTARSVLQPAATARLAGPAKRPGLLPCACSWEGTSRGGHRRHSTPPAIQERGRDLLTQ